MNILIIEDEIFAQEELKRLLKKTKQDIRILSCIDSIEESLQWFTTNEPPDLIFMDIQLSDGLSFEIFNKVKINTPVIFTTAYDEYAIRAFKVNSIDYLLKPIDEQALQNSLEKYERFKSEFSDTSVTIDSGQISELINFRTKKYKSRFVSRIGDKLHHILLSDIAYFQADDKILFLVTIKKEKYIIDNNLDEIESMIDPEIFFRINRRYLARIEAIANVQKYFNGRLIIELKPKADDQVLVSREKAAAFKQWLGM
jgi:two-component system, LytTR family, response regulator